MLFNTSFTIFNQYKDPESKKEKWIPTLFTKCLWTPKTETIPTNEGFKKVDMVNIFLDLHRLPKGKNFIEPKLYAKLPSSELEQYFTFNTMKDYVVKGDFQSELEPSNLAGRFVVQSALLYDYGLSHWEVIAK